MKSKSKLFDKEQLWGYSFISPMLIGFIVISLLPIIATIVISLTNWAMLNNDVKFIGFENYMKLFNDPLFYKVAKNTFLFTLLLIPSNLVLTLGLASLLRDNFKGVGFFRTAVFTPVVTTVVVWGILWKYIFQTDNGLVNTLLSMINLQGPQWLYNANLAIPVAVFVTLVKGLGLNTVIFIGAMKDVPTMYYEASEIDGASKMRQFFSITLPSIAPSIFLVTIITMIGSLKVFAQIDTLTGGGPGTSSFVFVYYIYQQAFKYYNFGYASAISAVLFCLIVILTIIQWKLRKRWVYHEN
ncbi:MAG: sugar ABC transporter permease [Clostridiaceae bacterium]|nr:sugar ABC transporter permease [Clostridiaceae bacterium]